MTSPPFGAPRAEWDAYMAKRYADRDRRRLATAHRGPPFALMRPQVRGTCQLCREPVTAEQCRPGAKPAQRLWHDGCLSRYFVWTRSDAQRNVCWHRDHGICRECGTDTTTILIVKPDTFYWISDAARPLDTDPERPVYYSGDEHGEQAYSVGFDWVPTLFEREAQRFPGRRRKVPAVMLRPFVTIRYDTAPWQADHIFPLWLVDRAELDAIRYWDPENLQTLCDPCHKRKSAREASSRAKVERIRDRRDRSTQELAL